MCFDPWSEEGNDEQELLEISWMDTESCPAAAISTTIPTQSLRRRATSTTKSRSSKNCIAQTITCMTHGVTNDLSPRCDQPPT